MELIWPGPQGTAENRGDWGPAICNAAIADSIKRIQFCIRFPRMTPFAILAGGECPSSPRARPGSVAALCLPFSFVYLFFPSESATETLEFSLACVVDISFFPHANTHTLTHVHARYTRSSRALLLSRPRTSSARLPRRRRRPGPAPL